MSARRRRQATAPGQPVRSRGLLVVTLVLIAGFVTGLSYLKQNTAERSPQPTNIAQTTAPAKPVASKPAQVPEVKPKYDFYQELPKRQVMIGKDDVAQKPQRTLQPPPENKPKQKPETSSEQAARPEVIMPKIELISRRERRTEQPTPASTQSASQASGNWMIQAGAYSTFADADRVRARLGMLGINARVEAASSNNRQVHRVRIGPMLSKDAADSINQRLTENKIPSIVFQTN